MRIKVSLHPLAAAGIAALLFVLPPETSYGMCAAVLCHEMSHLFVARLLKMKVRAIKLLPVGISVETSPPRTHLAGIAVALAGPLANAVLCALLYFSGMENGCNHATFLFSFSLGALNLLPIRSLDGGSTLLSLLALALDCDTAERISQAASAVSLAVIWLVAVYVLFYSTENASLLVFTAYLFAFTILKNDKMQNSS